MVTGGPPHRKLLLLSCEPVVRTKPCQQRALSFQHYARLRSTSTSTPRVHRTLSSRRNKSTLDTSYSDLNADFVPFDVSSLRGPPLKTIMSSPQTPNTPSRTGQHEQSSRTTRADTQSFDELDSFEPEIELRDDLKGANDTRWQRSAEAPEATETTQAEVRDYEKYERGAPDHESATPSGMPVTPKRASRKEERQRNKSKAYQSAGTKYSKADAGNSTPRNPRPLPPLEREPWQVHKDSMKQKLGGKRWDPQKKVSPDAMEGIRALHAQWPDYFTTPVLAKQFEVSSEAIRRILKSKWRANAEEEEDRRERWDRRGERIWTDLAEKGLSPPKKWREMGIRAAPKRRPNDRFPGGNAAPGSGKDDNDDPEAVTEANWLRSFASRVR